MLTLGVGSHYKMTVRVLPDGVRLANGLENPRAVAVVEECKSVQLEERVQGSKAIFCAATAAQNCGLCGPLQARSSTLIAGISSRSIQQGAVSVPYLWLRLAKIKDCPLVLLSHAISGMMVGTEIATRGEPTMPRQACTAHLRMAAISLAAGSKRESSVASLVSEPVRATSYR